MGPVLGPVPEVHGLYLSCGWLYGFMAAPGASELLAEAIVTGRVPELIEPFGIERLRSGRLILDDSLIQKPQALGAAA
jgi:sarcosine oxidase subunit beta